MALFSFLGESRIAMIGGEGDSILMRQTNPVEALLVDSFGGVSTLSATFKVPSEWVANILPGLNPRSRDWPDRRAYWLSFRGKHDEIRNFPILSAVEEERKDGIVTLKVEAADVRQWIDNVPGLKVGGATEVTDTAENLLIRITQRLSSLDDSIVQGKNDQFLLPATIFDTTWTPTPKQLSQGFVPWASYEDGTQFTIKDSGPQPAREMVDELLNQMEAHYGERFELWPLETPGTDGSASPWFRWVLRKREQTQVVLSEYSGTYSLDSITADLTNGDKQVYRSDDNLKYAFSSGTNEVASEWIGPWARMKFESVSVDDNASKSFVPRPKLPARVAFSGKGGVGYKIEPGSLGFVRNGRDINPVNLDAISTYYGSNDWSLGSVYSEMIHFDMVKNEGPTAESIVIKVAGSTTYSLPFQQAPLPQGGATYSVWEGGTLLAQATFNTDPISSAFTNVLQVTIGDTFEHELRIQVDGDDSYGRHTFGRANVWDGSLYDATDSVFRFMTAIVELPLQGFMREVTHGTAGAGHALYTARQFQGCLALSSIPVTESWGGYNEVAFVQNLWGFIPLSGLEAAKAYLGPMESQFELCLLLPTLPVEAHWPLLKKLATGYRNRQFFGNTNSNMGTYSRFGEMPSVTTIVSLGSAASLGWRRSQFESSRITGLMTFSVRMDALTTVPSYMMDRTFFDADWVTSLNIVVTVGTSTLLGDYFGNQIFESALRSESLSLVFTGSISEVSGSFFMRRATWATSRVGFQTSPVNIELPGLRTVSGNNFMENIYGLGAVARDEIVVPDFSQLETISGNYFMSQLASQCRANNVVLPQLINLETISGNYFMNLALSVTINYGAVSFPDWNKVKTIGIGFLYRVCWGGNAPNSNGQVTSIKFPALLGCSTVGASFFQQAFVRGAGNMAVVFPAWDTFTSIGTSFCFELFQGLLNGIRSYALPTLASLNVVPNDFFNYALHGNVNDIVFPAWNSFTTIGDNFFRNAWLSGLASFTLPTLNSCVSVGGYFFINFGQNAYNAGPATMETVTLPAWDTFTSVGQSFLEGFLKAATSVTSIVFPSLNACSIVGFYFLRKFLYGHTSFIPNLTFPNWAGFRTIQGPFLRLEIKSVGALTLPLLPNVTSVGGGFIQDLFAAASSSVNSTLTSITIPAYLNITSVGASPFSNAFTIPSLKTINWPTQLFTITALPTGWFAGAFRGSGIESMTFPTWSQFTSFGGQPTDSSQGVLAFAMADTKLLTTIVLPTFPNLAGGSSLTYWMAGFLSGSGLVDGAQIVEKAWNAVSTGYMMNFFQNCLNLQTLPTQALTGKSVVWTSYRESYARNCPALLPNQAVWDKPAFSTVPTHATLLRGRQWAAGGSSGTVHKWLDGSGSIVQPTAGTNALAVPANFYTA